MRLTRDVALVGGGALTGFGLSADFDSHVYLLDGGDELALVDTGMGTDAGMARVLAALEADGTEPERVKRILLTHYHTDHAGGAGRYRERLGARVAIGRPAAAAIRAADGEATQFGPAKASGMFPADYDYAACAVDDELVDGQRVTVGRLTVEYVATPGHCTGHGAFVVTGGERTYLFSGDALFYGGRIQLQAIPDCDLALSLESVQRLAGLSFDALLPGHGAIALMDGHLHADAAVAAISRLAVPANLV